MLTSFGETAMHRALVLAIALTAFPAAALDLESWVDKLSSDDPKERLEAVRYLSGRSDPESIAALAKALSDRDARVRHDAANALWKAEKAAEPARTQLMA